MNLPLIQYYTLLQQYLWPQWRRLLGLGILLLAGIGLQLLPPQLMGRFLDRATTGGSVETLTRLAALVIGAVLVQQICAVLAAYLSEDVAWTATNRLRTQLMEHCLYLELSFHHTRTPGEMIERFDSDVTLLANFFSQFVVLVVGNLLLLVGVLALLFQTDGRIGLVGLGLALVMLLTLARLRNLGIPYAVAHRQSNADLYAYLEERLGGIEELRANGAVADTMRRFYLLLRTVFRKSLMENWTFSIPFAVLILLTTVGTAGVLAVCAYLYGRNAMTIGTVYLVFHYTALLSTPINAITHQVEDFQRAGSSMIRLQELQGIASKLKEVSVQGGVEQTDAERLCDMTTPSVVTSKALAVTFDRVTFGYESNTPVLHDICFHLPAGRTLGLLGRTGSGKSSLARLLLRLYDPQQGSIHLGHDHGCDLRPMPLAQVRQQVGLVTQHVQLFHATLRDNLTFWNPTITDSQIDGALAELGLTQWLKSLPNGLDTLLSASGGSLSAGEAQLVAFARIFLRDPGLVILDEASSRLDPVTEARLEGAIARLLRGRTAIIIAHRLATVRRVDEILILDNGRIVEHAQRIALEQNPRSRFAQLLQTGLTEVLA